MDAHARSPRRRLTAWVAALALTSTAAATAVAAHALPTPASAGYTRAPIEDEYALLTLANMSRAGAHTKPLVWNDSLGLAARQHSWDMAMHPDDCFQHDSCDGTPWRDRIASYYGSSSVQENIGGGGGPLSTHNVWMGSPGHRAAIMSSSWTEFGAATMVDAYSSSYATEDFGTKGPIAIPPIPGGTAILPREENSRVWQWQVLVNFYDGGSKAATSATAYVDGTPQPLSLLTGTKTNGTWAAFVAAPGYDANGFRPAPYCKRVYFQVARNDGQTFRYPATGEIGLGYAPGCDVRTDASTPPPPPPPNDLHVVIDSPAQNAHVSGNVQIRAHADGAVKIEVWIDQKRVVTKHSSTVTRGWSAGQRSVASGAHTITVKAYPAPGAGPPVSASVTVTK